MRTPDPAATMIAAQSIEDPLGKAHPISSDVNDVPHETAPHPPAGAAAEMPTRQEMALRALWLRSLSADDRERLTDLSLRVVEGMFHEWASRQDGSPAFG